MSAVIDEHRIYLSDRARLAAYTSALEQAVRPGDVVLDLGCGTGILGLIACRAGAARVYALDATGMIEVARRLARDNGYADRVVHLKQSSLYARLPEPVDVIVCDQMGGFGFEGGVIEYLADARRRFLKPGGKLVPGGLSLYVAPVEARDEWAQVNFWKSVPAGFEFSSMGRWAANTRYSARFKSPQLLGEPALGTTVDLSVATVAPIQFETCLTACRPGTLHGITGWFSAALADTVSLSNSPLVADPIDRAHVFFPVENPVCLEAGVPITVGMHIIPVDSVVTWTVSVAGRTFQHSTFNGMLLSREQLARTHPTFKPRLTRRGEARASVLSLCNGRRVLTEIEDCLFRRYPDLFATRNQAAVFVSDVVANSAK